MKALRTLILLGTTVLPLCAGDVAQNRAEEIGKTYKVFGANNAQVYRNVTVTNITDAGITIQHADGLARLRYDHLSAEQREKFGITREDAEAIYAEEMKAQAAYEAQVAAIQKERQAAQQKAHEALLAKQAAALLEAQRMEAERLKAQPQATQNATSIVSVLEVPHFPVIRGYNNEILYPIQNSSRPHRRSYSGSNSYTYPVYRGGTYGYPVRYGGSHCYPGGSYCRPSYGGGSWGWINYRGSKVNIGLSW